MLLHVTIAKEIFSTFSTIFKDAVLLLGDFLEAAIGNHL